jgi:hypothetical protein
VTPPTSASFGSAGGPEAYSKNSWQNAGKAYSNLRGPTPDLTSAASGRHRRRRGSGSGRHTLELSGNCS